MRVKQLIKILKTMDPDLVVVLSSDEEGNSFGELRDVVEDVTEEDNVPCVILWP